MGHEKDKLGTSTGHKKDKKGHSWDTFPTVRGKVDRLMLAALAFASFPFFRKAIHFDGWTIFPGFLLITHHFPHLKSAAADSLAEQDAR
jgi:hypothetical protein